MSKEISRRDFLKLAGLGTAGFLVSGCAIENRATSTEKTPKPPTGIVLPPTELAPAKPTPIEIKPTPTKPTKPTPAETKEVKQGILWTQELLFSSKKREAFFVNQDKLFLATPEGYPAAFNLATGKKLWQWEERGIVYGAEPETVYMVRSDKRLYALDAPTGETKWKTVFGVDEFTKNRNIDWPLWIGAETLHLPFGMLSFGINNVFANIDKKTGNILWWGNGRDGNDSDPWIRGSTIVALTKETLLVFFPYWQELVGFVPSTGEKKWVRSGGYYFSQNSFLWWKDGGLAAFEIDSNKQLWQTERNNFTEIIGLSPNRIYASFEEKDKRSLTVLDLQTGKELWNQQNFFSDGYHFVGEIKETTILGHENLGYTHALEASTGTTLWINDDLRLSRLAGISKNTLIAEYNNPDSSPPFLFGLDPATGGRKWRLELSQVTHEAIIFHDKVIYGNGRALTVLDPETGALLSTIPLPDQPTRLAPQKDFLLAQSKENLSAVLI